MQVDGLVPQHIQMVERTMLPSAGLLRFTFGE